MWENGIFAQQNSGTSEDKVSQGRINFQNKGIARTWSRFRIQVSRRGIRRKEAGGLGKLQIKSHGVSGRSRSVYRDTETFFHREPKIEYN